MGVFDNIKNLFGPSSKDARDDKKESETGSVQKEEIGTTKKIAPQTTMSQIAQILEKSDKKLQSPQKQPVAAATTKLNFDRRALTGYLEQIAAEMTTEHNTWAAFVNDEPIDGRKISFKELQVVRTKLATDLSGLLTKQKLLSPLGEDEEAMLNFLIDKGTNILNSIDETIAAINNYQGA